MCGTYFKKIQGITKRLQKNTNFFFNPLQMYQDFIHLLQNPKVLREAFQKKPLNP